MKYIELGEICEIQIGKTPSRSVSEYWNGDLPWVTISDLSDNRIVIETKEKITRVGAKKSGSKLIPEGTLLLSFKLSLGKRAFAGTDLFTNEAIAALNPINSNEVCNDYLYWALGSFDYDRLVDRAAKGKTLNKAKLRILKIPLPPLEEQKRIALILDTADEIRAKRRQSIEELDRLAQSVFLDMFGDPVTNPKGWKIQFLGDLGKWQSGGTPPRKSIEYYNGNIPWISSGELNSIYIEKSKETISEEAIRETSAKLVPKGSIMLGMYDTAALKSSIAKVDCSCNQAIAFSKLDEETANTIYAYYAIQIGREEFRKLQRGIRQKNLNLTMVKAIKIPLPPISLQKKFASIIQSIEAQKSLHQQHLTELDNLFASLQSRAFNGSL